MPMFGMPMFWYTSRLGMPKGRVCFLPSAKIFSFRLRCLQPNKVKLGPVLACLVFSASRAIGRLAQTVIPAHFPFVVQKWLG